MSWARKNPWFASALAVCALLGLGEGWCIYERAMAAREAEAKLDARRAELHAMAELSPAPTRAVATAIEADLARARRSLGAMEAELKGHGPAAEQLRTAKVPGVRTDAYFDLATFVEKMREHAHRAEVDVRPEAARFGFAAFANEGPELDHIEPVFRQRLILQYLLESLFEARPRALLAVRREPTVTQAERTAREAASTAASDAAAAEPATENNSAPTPPEGPDYFAMDPRASARVPSYVDALAFRFVFIGQTAALRNFLNHLATFELPVLVREVEVEPAPPEETSLVVPTEEQPSADPNAPSVVLVRPSVDQKKMPARTTAIPIVPKGFSKFTVTLEYIEVIPPVAAATEEPVGAPGS